MRDTHMVVTLEIPLQRIADLLCSAFEGGSNYWYMIEKFGTPVGDPESWAFRTDKSHVYRHMDYPLNAGGYLIVSDAKGEDDKEKQTKKKLNLAAVEEGLTLMSTEQPQHFANFMAENDDAETGDVFLQLCVFGKLVYG